MKTIALLVANGIIIYFVVGLCFGVYFFLKGAGKIDSLIKESKWTVRLLLLPGAIVTWPLLLSKLLISKNKKL